jgi:hypothetical protein
MGMKEGEEGNDCGGCTNYSELRCSSDRLLAARLVEMIKLIVQVL